MSRHGSVIIIPGVGCVQSSYFGFTNTISNLVKVTFLTSLPVVENPSTIL